MHTPSANGIDIDPQTWTLYNNESDGQELLDMYIHVTLRIRSY